MNRTIDITAVSKLKHADLWEAAKRLGERRLASHVKHLTNSLKVAGQNRQDKKREDVARIAGIPYECKIVKLIDRIDNLMEIDRADGFCKLYASESLLLLEVLRGVDDALAAELESLANGLLE